MTVLARYKLKIKYFIFIVEFMFQFYEKYNLVCIINFTVHWKH